MIIAAIVALLFGKITIKEIKEYVRKYTKRSGNDDSGRDSSGNTDTGEQA